MKGRRGRGQRKRCGSRVARRAVRSLRRGAAPWFLARRLLAGRCQLFLLILLPVLRVWVQSRLALAGDRPALLLPLLVGAPVLEPDLHAALGHAELLGQRGSLTLVGVALCPEDLGEAGLDAIMLLLGALDLGTARFSPSLLRSPFVLLSVLSLIRLVLPELLLCINFLLL